MTHDMTTVRHPQQQRSHKKCRIGLSTFLVLTVTLSLGLVLFQLNVALTSASSSRLATTNDSSVARPSKHQQQQYKGEQKQQSQHLPHEKRLQEIDKNYALLEQKDVVRVAIPKEEAPANHTKEESSSLTINISQSTQHSTSRTTAATPEEPPPKKRKRAKRARTNTITTKESQPLLLSDLIDTNSTTPSLKIQNVSFLLDFAYIGFSKCGSTSLGAWLTTAFPNTVYMPKREPKWLWKGPINAVEKLYPHYQENFKRQQQQQQQPHVVVGYKKPRDIFLPHVMETLRVHFPGTKLVVGIRHPILWFESFYNFRLIDGGTRKGATLPHPNALIGPCILDEHVCTDHARFHLQIALALRKTPMTSRQELNLLFNGNATAIQVFQEQRTQQPDVDIPMPNPVFVYDMSQIFLEPTTIATNNSSSSSFATDLVNFLQIPLSRTASATPAVLTIPQTHPEQGRHISKERLAKGQAHRINICESQYDQVRSVLLQHAQNTAEWMNEFLLPLANNVGEDSPFNHSNKNTANVLVSSKETLSKHLLESYFQDPCEERAS